MRVVEPSPTARGAAPIVCIPLISREPSDDAKALTLAFRHEVALSELRPHRPLTHLNRMPRIPCDALAVELLTADLAPAEHDLKRALTDLAEIRGRVRGKVDAVALVREGRDELERRTL